MTPYHHAVSSSQKWGGTPEVGYLAIHEWFDQTKLHMGDIRHRAVLHSSFGVGLCEQMFGTTMTNSNGRTIPVRWVAEQHVKEDCGFIPSVKDWMQNLKLLPWMSKVAVRSRDLEIS